MATVPITDQSFESLRGNNCIVTGGSSGIGAATVKLLYKHGANVLIADLDSTNGESLAKNFPADRVLFHHTDVTSWSSLSVAFSTAVRHFGDLDIVFANAGISGDDRLLIDEFDRNTGDLLPPDLKICTTNLTGAIYTAKLALHHFGERTGSLVFTASAASYLDTPPLWTYCASKHGVLGLMRALRCRGDAVTVNVVAPWFTDTPMADATFAELWGERPANTPEGVARGLLFAAVGREWRDSNMGGRVHGCGFWVGGDIVIEMEEEIRNGRAVWLGSEMAEKVNEGQCALGAR